MLHYSFHYLHQLKTIIGGILYKKLKVRRCYWSHLLICLSYSVPSCIRPERQIADLSMRSINWCLKWSPLKWTPLHRSLVRPLFKYLSWCKSLQRFLLYSVVNFLELLRLLLLIERQRYPVVYKPGRKKYRSLKHGFYMR